MSKMEKEQMQKNSNCYKYWFTNYIANHITEIQNTLNNFAE